MLPRSQRGCSECSAGDGFPLFYSQIHKFQSTRTVYTEDTGGPPGYVTDTEITHEPPSIATRMLGRFGLSVSRPCIAASRRDLSARHLPTLALIVLDSGNDKAHDRVVRRML